MKLETARRIVLKRYPHARPGKWGSGKDPKNGEGWQVFNCGIAWDAGWPMNPLSRTWQYTRKQAWIVAARVLLQRKEPLRKMCNSTLHMGSGMAFGVKYPNPKGK